MEGDRLFGSVCRGMESIRLQGSNEGLIHAWKHEGGKRSQLYVTAYLKLYKCITLIYKLIGWLLVCFDICRKLRLLIGYKFLKLGTFLLHLLSQNNIIHTWLTSWGSVATSISVSDLRAFRLSLAVVKRRLAWLQSSIRLWSEPITSLRTSILAKIESPMRDFYNLHKNSFFNNFLF